MSFDSKFDLTLDAGYDDFDPLEDVGEDEDEEGAEHTAVSAATDAPDAIEQAPAADARTPQERIDDLFKSMAPAFSSKVHRFAAE